MNNKGQALVEFVIILPIFLMILFCVIDFSRVISLKNELENVSSDVSNLYQNNKTDFEIKEIFKEKDADIDIKIENEGQFIRIIVNKRIEPITPGLNRIKKDVFDVKCERVIKINDEIGDENE